MENTWVRTSSVQETCPRVATLDPTGTPPLSRKDPERNRRVAHGDGRLQAAFRNGISPKKHLGEAGLSLVPPQWG